jgi:hypothetical protein
VPKTLKEGLLGVWPTTTTKHVYLNRANHIRSLPPQIQQASDGGRDEHGVTESCELDEVEDIIRDQEQQREEGLKNTVENE